VGEEEGKKRGEERLRDKEKLLELAGFSI